MQISTVAIIGAGVIGAGWAARLIENSVNVNVYDPSPNAQKRLDTVLENAERAYAKLTMASRPAKGQVTLSDSIGEAAEAAELIIESVPENIELKHKAYGEVEDAASSESIIASSTSGILPSQLQSGMKNPERLLVAHPFNPVYLLPAVEIVGGETTNQQAINLTCSFLSSIGMKPVHIKKEIDAFVADRLLEAMWRESLWLIKDGICTSGELDEIIRNGFGLRFAQMGIFETYRTAGGDAGMRHFLKQFGPALKWPWTKLTDVPDLDDELVDLIVSQSDEQSGHFEIPELECIRDDNLVAIQQALKANEWGAGIVLGEYEKKLFDAGAAKNEDENYSEPIVTMERRVPPDWTDYNNHMNEARYLQCFGDATDAFMRMMGVDAEYIEAGNSFFTVETHIRHLEEVRVNEPIYATTQLIESQGKKMHVFHHLYHRDGTLLATGEHLLLHVSLAERATSEPSKEVRERLDKVAMAHADLPLPEGLGRAVGQKQS
ncbi:MAG: carnitine 3-dehydrogenase [Rhizobiaceae bacterium]